MGLAHNIREVLPSGAIVAGGGLDPKDRFLFPEEEALVCKAVTKRRREFLAGRSYARQALSRFGCDPAPILAEQSRLPRWPLGFTGTISHSTALCAAIVARTSDVASIGLDIEDDAPLANDIVSLICCEADLHNRPMIERSIRIDLPKLVFVAKEAYYKTYYPLTGCFLDFADVEVAINPNWLDFEARLVNGARPSFTGRRHLSGKFGHIGKTVFAIAWLPTPTGWRCRGRREGRQSGA